MKFLLLAILLVSFTSASAGPFPNTKAGWDAASEEVKKKLEELQK